LNDGRQFWDIISLELSETLAAAVDSGIEKHQVGSDICLALDRGGLEILELCLIDFGANCHHGAEENTNRFAQNIFFLEALSKQDCFALSHLC